MSDYSGNENLELISLSRRFNDWIYQQVRPALTGDILEIGSGIGTISERIIHDLPNRSTVTLTDVSMKYVKRLKERFLAADPDGPNKNNTNVQHDSHNSIAIQKLDLSSVADFDSIGYEKFDSIVAINVLEHIKNDEFALRHLYQMLRKYGKLVLLVPCHNFLYNVMDNKIGHFRRYTKRELKSKAENADFSVRRMFYFNMLGIIGWYINGNLLHKPTLSSSASGAFDKLVPVLRQIERITGHRLGLSIICYLSKE